MHHFAYIDSGTGSIFIQAVLGVILAGSVFFRTSVKRLFGRGKSADKQNTVHDED